MKDIENRINNLEKRLKTLEGIMHDSFDLLRKDLDRIFDGDDDNPGVLRKLDKLDEIVQLLKANLPT